VGVKCSYAGGESFFVTGEVAPGMLILVSGSAEVKRRDPLGHLAPITVQGPSEFVAEIGGYASCKVHSREHERNGASSQE
jgi:thioredoxin reductase (NADPH)